MLLRTGLIEPGEPPAPRPVIHYTLSFTPSLKYVWHARAVLSACVRRVLVLVWLPVMRVALLLIRAACPPLISLPHTPRSQVSGHSLPLLSLNETMRTVSSEPGGDMCQVAAARGLPKNTTITTTHTHPTPSLDAQWPLAPFVHGACTSKCVH